MARQKTNRQASLFPRVQEVNAKWFEKNRKKFENGQADLLDRMFTYLRKHPKAINFAKI
jgi:hypothetical protein